jgi:hypothetical protein
MRIDSSGNVCVGSTAAGNAGALNVSVGLAGTTAGGIQLWSSTTAAHSIQWGDGTSSTDPYRGYIEYAHNGDSMRFATQSTERARIDSSGNLLIGTTATDPTNGAVCRREAAAGTFWINATTNTTAWSHWTFKNGNGIVGQITTTGTSTAYNTSSDYRLKHDIQPMTGALAKVAQLKPVTYKWNADDADGEGFIAHELQEVAPYAVSGEKDGEEMQGVDYGKITPLLTAALQEAIAEIQSLKARVAELEAK